MKKRRKMFVKRMAAVILTLCMIMGMVPSVITVEAHGNSDGYPYNVAAGSYVADQWGFYQCECTSFVAWCLNARNGFGFSNGMYGSDIWGNANNWGDVARRHGFAVDGNPAVGAVAWSSSGTNGHVAWVCAVNGDNVTIDEYNNGWVTIAGEYHGNHKYNTRTVHKSAFQYIHLKDIPQTPPTTEANNPKGCVDNAEGRTNTVWVRGWAFDPDAVSQSIEIHVYIGGPAGVGEGHSGIIANACREDVNNVFGAGIYHGFDATIRTSLTGTQTVYVYAINVGAGTTNPLIGTKTVTISQDTTAPTITDVRVTDLNSEGYTVSCCVEDAEGIAKVQFPTWTAANGQDDLAENCQDNPSCRGTQDGTTWSFRVNDKEHNFERGIYCTHIYAYDNNGNRTWYELNDIVLQNTYSHVNAASYNGHTYYLYNDILTWDEAKARCEELRGHLVTITSTDEQETVAGLIQGQARRAYWIGGSSDNDSTWVTGEEFSFSNWEPGGPNADGGEDCYGIYADKGTWDDWFGSNRTLGLGFICEWDEEKVDNPGNPDKESSTTYTYKLNDDKTTITITKYTASDENVAIPSSIDGYAVTGIDEKAFQNITTMKTISFPSSLKSIGNYAFAGCTSLTMVTLPESLTELGNYAFQGCVALQSAKLNAGWKNVSEGFFQGCTSLSSVTLPDTIQYIRPNAFSGCTSLKTLSLPKSLSIIYANAFLNSGIKTIQYAGTNTDWQNVTIGTTGNTSFLNATVTGSNGKTFSANKSKWNTSSPAPVKKPSVSKVKSFKATAGKKKLTLTWKKLSGVAGYQIQISTKNNFKGTKTISVSKSKNTYTKKNLKAKKKYYIRVRAYKTYKDANKKTQKVYGKWTTMSKKTK